VDVQLILQCITFEIRTKLFQNLILDISVQTSFIEEKWNATTRVEFVKNHNLVVSLLVIEQVSNQKFYKIEKGFGLIDS